MVELMAFESVEKWAVYSADLMVEYLVVKMAVSKAA